MRAYRRTSSRCEPVRFALKNLPASAVSLLSSTRRNSSARRWITVSWPLELIGMGIGMSWPWRGEIRAGGGWQRATSNERELCIFTSVSLNGCIFAHKLFVRAKNFDLVEKRTFEIPASIALPGVAIWAFVSEQRWIRPQPIDADEKHAWAACTPDRFGSRTAMPRVNQHFGCKDDALQDGP